MSSFKTPKGTTLPILNLKGKDYLQVAHRLVWFREERSDWRIETEFVALDDQSCIAKAIIRNESGQIMATAHKREDRGHFPDFMEKAETGAIGRALAYCGYGTQFCADEIDEGVRIVDAPQAKPAVRALPVKKEIKSLALPKGNQTIAPRADVKASSPVSTSAWEEFERNSDGA